MGASLCALHVPSGFGGRAESGVGRSRTFPQVVLAAITEVEGGARDGMARALASILLGLLPPFIPRGGRSRLKPVLLCSMAITTPLAAELVLKVLEQKP